MYFQDFVSFTDLCVYTEWGRGTKNPTTSVILLAWTVCTACYWIGNLNLTYSQVLDFGVFLFDSLGILNVVLQVSMEKYQPSGLRADLSDWEHSLNPGSGTNHGCHIWQIT